MSRRRTGFTLIELIIALFCTMLLLNAAFTLFRSGVQASRKGIIHVDTVQEAKRVLRRIHDDLKMACFHTVSSSGVVNTNFRHMVQRAGTAPQYSFSFASFPQHGPISEVFPENVTEGPAYRNVARISYTLENPRQVGDQTVYELIRSEQQNAGVNQRVLSKRVRLMTIDPIMIHAPTTGVPKHGGEQSHYFWYVTLQLADSIGPSTAAGASGTVPASSMVIADFSDIVSSRFHWGLSHTASRWRNWHSEIQDPVPPVASP
jgi:type II secretory pathway component PulJ